VTGAGAVAVDHRRRSDAWPSAKARHVLASLLKIGWAVKRTAGSHRVLARQGWPNYVWAFKDGEEIGPRMLARIARSAGLSPRDL